MKISKPSIESLIVEVTGGPRRAGERDSSVLRTTIGLAAHAMRLAQEIISTHKAGGISMFRTVRRNLLLQLDGKLPNLALMRLSAFLKQRGEAIDFRRIRSPLMLEHGLFDEPWTSVYASLIFERTRPIAERLKRTIQTRLSAERGGTGALGWRRSA